MGWGPVEWGGRGIPEAKFEKNAPCFFIFLDLSNRYQDICKRQCLGTSWMDLGPDDWVGRVLPEAKFEEEKMHPRFKKKIIWATDTEISVKNGAWGPVEWVGDQLTGWGGSSQKQNSKKKMHLVFFNFLIWATDTQISVKNGAWGPVDWVGKVLPEAKFEKNAPCFFNLLRYL